MRRLLGFAVLLASFHGLLPQRLDAASEKCFWWWTHSIIEIDTITGAYTETRYYKWVCWPDEPY
jgi:hypothetical protein